MMTSMEYLQVHWGEAYLITAADGKWQAVRRDNQRALAATCAEDLYSLIVSDYVARPVDRSGGVA